MTLIFLILHKMDESAYSLCLRYFYALTFEKLFMNFLLSVPSFNSKSIILTPCSKGGKSC